MRQFEYVQVIKVQVDSPHDTRVLEVGAHRPEHQQTTDVEWIAGTIASERGGGQSTHNAVLKVNRVQAVARGKDGSAIEVCHPVKTRGDDRNLSDRPSITRVHERGKTLAVNVVVPVDCDGRGDRTDDKMHGVE